MGPMPRLNTRRDSTGPELARMTGAFGQQLSFAQRIMESGACPILLIDMSPDPLIQYASPGLETLTGYAAQELLGRRWTLFFAPTDPASVLAASRLAPKCGSDTRIALSMTNKSGVAPGSWPTLIQSSAQSSIGCWARSVPLPQRMSSAGQ